jgi:D-ribose pyranase
MEEEKKKMKSGGLLHPELAFQIASCGHRDLICIADAGLPLPRNVPRIDLAYAPGKPPFFDVLKTVLQEIALEEVCWAEEAEEKSPHLVQRFEDLFRELPQERIPHEEFKARLEAVRFVVRTGEFTPYANVLLRCGVPF